MQVRRACIASSKVDDRIGLGLGLLHENNEPCEASNRLSPHTIHVAGIVGGAAYAPAGVVEIWRVRHTAARSRYVGLGDRRACFWRDPGEEDLCGLSHARSSMWRADVWGLCCRVASVEGIQVVLCHVKNQYSSASVALSAIRAIDQAFKTDNAEMI